MHIIVLTLPTGPLDCRICCQVKSLLRGGPGAGPLQEGRSALLSSLDAASGCLGGPLQGGHGAQLLLPGAEEQADQGAQVGGRANACRVHALG